MNETVFFRYEDICYGVLASLNISHRSQDYQDYLQTAFLTLVQFLNTHKLPSEESPEDYLLRGFLFQHIRWALIDTLRKQQTRLLLPLEEGYESAFVCDDLSKIVLDHCLIAELTPLLTTEECVYLSFLLKDMSATKIAESLNVSRQTLYKRRKNIQKKIFFLLFG